MPWKPRPTSELTPAADVDRTGRQRPLCMRLAEPSATRQSRHLQRPLGLQRISALRCVYLGGVQHLAGTPSGRCGAGTQWWSAAHRDVPPGTGGAARISVLAGRHNGSSSAGAVGAGPSGTVCRPLSPSSPTQRSGRGPPTRTIARRVTCISYRSGRRHPPRRLPSRRIDRFPRPGRVVWSSLCGSVRVEARSWCPRRLHPPCSRSEGRRLAGIASPKLSESGCRRA